MTTKRIKFLVLSGVLLIGVPFFVYSTTYGWQWDWHRLLPMTSENEAAAVRLRNTVTVLAERIGMRNQHRPERLNAAAAFIEETLRGEGYQVGRQSYRVGAQEFYNIIADHPQAAADGPYLILAAHYDSHANPGADDNASGVAVLVETARRLRDHPLKSRLRLIAFVNEEPPFFKTEHMGSHVYAARARREGHDIGGVIVLEMVGYYTRQPFSQRYLAFMGPFYPNQGEFLAVVGNFASAALTGRVYRAIRRGRWIPVEKLVAPAQVPGVYFSDHWSFWQHDYPAVMVTDTAFLRNPHYHTAADTPATLDYGMMARTVWAVCDAVLDLDAKFGSQNESGRTP